MPISLVRTDYEQSTSGKTPPVEWIQGLVRNIQNVSTYTMCLKFRGINGKNQMNGYSQDEGNNVNNYKLLSINLWMSSEHVKKKQKQILRWNQISSTVIRHSFNPITTWSISIFPTSYFSVFPSIYFVDKNPAERISIFFEPLFHKKFLLTIIIYFCFCQSILQRQFGNFNPL